MANPRRVRRFAESLGQRSKTDPVDARVLCQYAQRMPLLLWQPPSAAALRLRALGRTIAALVRMCTQHKNRQHALAASAALPASLVRELEAQVRYTEKRIEAAPRGRAPDRLRARVGAPFPASAERAGIGESSALAVLGELAVLPGSLDERQWVAHGGLDPKHHLSGCSVEQKPHISKAGNRSAGRALHAGAGSGATRSGAAGLLPAAGGPRKGQTTGPGGGHAQTPACRLAMFRTDQPYDAEQTVPAA